MTNLQVKRTSAWNKASEELKRYQELYEKYKDKPEFVNSQYGDPFDGEKVSQLTTSFGQDSESEVSEREAMTMMITMMMIMMILMMMCFRVRRSRTESPESPERACR